MVQVKNKLGGKPQFRIPIQACEKLESSGSEEPRSKVPTAVKSRAEEAPEELARLLQDKTLRKQLHETGRKLKSDTRVTDWEPRTTKAHCLPLDTRMTKMKTDFTE